MLRSALHPPALRLLAPRSPARLFHSTPRALVKVGDAIPSVDVMEGGPGNVVNLATEFRNAGGRGLVVGVPAAFSTSTANFFVFDVLRYWEAARVDDG
jgi:peroxiredoxin 5